MFGSVLKASTFVISIGGNSGLFSAIISSASLIFAKPRCPKISNLKTPTSSAIFISNCTVGYPFGGKSVAE